MDERDKSRNPQGTPIGGRVSRSRCQQAPRRCAPYNTKRTSSEFCRSSIPPRHLCRCRCRRCHPRRRRRQCLPLEPPPPVPSALPPPLPPPVPMPRVSRRRLTPASTAAAGRSAAAQPPRASCSTSRVSSAAADRPPGTCDRAVIPRSCDSAAALSCHVSRYLQDRWGGYCVDLKPTT
jgi:hypothetical protein